MDDRLVLPVNTVLDGTYRILRVVGSGGFGVTYEAEDGNLRIVVAIKEYYPIEFGDRDARMNVCPKSERHKKTFDWGRQNFLEEARTLVRFEHPSIVQVTRVFEANSTAYMVMRFEHGWFKSWVNNLGRPPSQQELGAIIAPLLDAMQMMHAADFLHRDIAPDNIIVRADGTPVLLDFGAARRAFAEMSRSPGGVIKAGYSPPEQYSLDSRLQGPWSDLYALGATLYHAIAGRVPEEATLRVDNDQMVPARLAGKGKYGDEFLAAIDACLHVKHSERPQSVAQLRSMLLGQDEKQGLPGENSAAAGTSAKRTRTAPGNKSTPRWLGAAVVVLLVLGGAIAANEFRRHHAPEPADDEAEVQRKESAALANRKLTLELQRKEADRIAREAEEARKQEAERKAELEAEQRRNNEKAATEAEERRLAEYTALVRSLQTALTKVGCYSGDADGQWNAKARTALDQFTKHTKLNLSTDQATNEALYAVVARAQRVCPLQCAEGTKESDSKCVQKAPQARPRLALPRAKKPSEGDDAPTPHPARGGYVTCGRNGCQTVPRGCYAIRGGGGGGLGGRIVCP